MSRIKILYVSHSSRIGGAEVCLLTLVKHLDKNLFEPVVVLPTPGPLRQKITALGIRTYISPLEWWIRAPAEFNYQGAPVQQRVQGLVEIIRREKPDIVHTNTSVIWEGTLAARLTGVPHVWHIHEILEVHPVLRSLFPLPTVYLMMDELSAQLVTVSAAVQTRLADAIASKKLSVIYNGIEWEELALTQQAERGPTVRDELKVPNDAILAITIGSLVPEKGHDVLLQAAALHKQRGGQVYFVLVGSGNPLAVRRLRQQIKALGLTDSVRYLGFRRDVTWLLESSNFLVLPSYTDAFPLAVLEAMAKATPVIATDSGGAREMIVDGESGLVVPVGDAEMMCDSVEQLAQDVRQRMEMGAAAFKRFKEKFTAEVYVANFQNLYREILNTPQHPPSVEIRQEVVDAWIKSYEALYEKSQAEALKRSPLSWRIGKVLRWGKGVARKWMFEREMPGL